jgi:hypothetical protein
MVKRTQVDQAKRFEEAAREAGADESGETFERVFGKIVPPKRRPPEAPKEKKSRHV